MSKLDSIASYWNMRSEGYSETIHHEMETGEAGYYGEKLRIYAPKKTGLDCLDVGCGPGLFTILLSREGYHVTSVDYSEGMLEQAKRNIEEAGFTPVLVRSDATKLPFEDESFDYIVSRNLVWNLEHPTEAYEEWLRILRPGGRILVIDANHYLHYYDETYKKAHYEIMEKNYGHKHMRGVNPNMISEIARELPLSKELRPEWDITTFRKLGITIMQVETRTGWFNRTDGKDMNLIGEFFVCVQKGREEGADLTDRVHHFSKTADNYNKIVTDEWNSFRAEAWVKQILENQPEGGISCACDLGCGPGFFSVLLAKQGISVIGMDASTPMLVHAKKNADAAGVNPVFMCGDVTTTPFNDNTFDLLICRNLTHMIEDHKKAYKEWQRILKPGGRLLIFDANWHLTTTDPELRKAYLQREDETFEKYGSNYNDKNQRSRDKGVDVGTHRLGRAVRPAFDLPILEAAGFSQIKVQENISDYLWDEKEKLLYGLTPMFMICAEK